jgi:hypothetical protein
LLSQPATAVAEQRLQFVEEARGDQQLDPLIQQMIDQLGPDSVVVQQYLAAQRERQRLPGQRVVEQVAAKLGQAQAQAPPSRRLAEHVAVIDTLKSWTVADVSRMARARGDRVGALAAAEAHQFATDSLGLIELRCLFDFPMALCAMGYTRGSAYPDRATLRPFQVASAEGRTSIYVLSTDTEAIMLQLDPIRLARWLHHNGIVAADPPIDPLECWVWLRHRVPELAAQPWQEAWHTGPVRAVRTLLHTISHLLLRHAEWSGFDPESIGEYLLPETLAVVLYTNRYTGFTIGGLVTLFEQRLLNWLEATYAEGASCIYDPFCTDEGGACAGCIHRRYNCELFNEDLSRATLYGGILPDGGEIKRGYWEV